MSHPVKERFIILKKTKYGEADLILHALSVQGEKISFMARAALKSKKRFGGGILEPTHFCQFTYKKSSLEGKINTLEEATLINDFQGVRKTYERLDFALHVLDCVARVSQEGDSNSAYLFNLLGHTLKAIEGADDLDSLKMHFYLKFLLQQGVMTTEPWMNPFLKINISETNTLAAHKDQVAEHLFTLEIMVKQYIENATL